MSATEGGRLRKYLADRFDGRYGWVTRLSRESGVKRGTIYGWFSGAAQPDLGTLAQIATSLKVPRAALVAAMDDEPLSDPPSAAELVPAVQRAVTEAMDRNLSASAAQMPPAPPLVRDGRVRYPSRQPSADDFDLRASRRAWWLRTGREARRMTRPVLAERLSVPVGDVVAWEAGEAEPTLRQFRDLAIALDAPLRLLTDPPGTDLERFLEMAGTTTEAEVAEPRAITRAVG